MQFHFVDGDVGDRGEEDSFAVGLTTHVADKALNDTTVDPFEFHLRQVDFFAPLILRMKFNVVINVHTTHKKTIPFSKNHLPASI
ncbi:MAG TPA: hypothetical protein VJ733_12750 [Candidatus Binatia bacterium]|nr:hypothetical protein [Candidatus Binatia bacterium]